MRVPRSVGLIAAAGLLLLSCASHARADEAAESGEPPPTFESGNIAEDALSFIREERRALVDFGVRSFAGRINETLEARTGIRFGLAYTMLYQHASDGRGPRDAWGGDLDVLGSFTPKRLRGTGQLSVAFENRHKIETDIAPQGLSNTIDSLWPTVSGFNEQNLAMTQFYWRQDFLGDRLTLRIGKISPYFFFGNRLNDVNTAFVNAAFSDSPEVFFPGNGFGLHGKFDFPGDRWTVRAGIQNANGQKTAITFESLSQGEFWYAVQIERHTSFRRLGKGNYRAGVWYVDSRENAGTGSGAGFVLSFDQELGDRFLAFARLGYQGSGLITPEIEDDALTGTQSALRVGLGVSRPFRGRTDDYFGVAAAWGKPSRTRPNPAAVGEVFYRAFLTDFSHLSVSLQAIRSSLRFDEVFVFGVRYRVEF